MNTLTVTQTDVPATQTLKSTTMLEVKQAIVVLLSCEDTTTTLEVKTLLRSRGYHATQRLVSKLMHELADEGYLSTQDAGDYCLFSAVQVVAAPIQIN